MGRLLGLVWTMVLVLGGVGGASGQDVLKAGLSTIELESGGHRRSYVAVVPNSYAHGTPTPLVIVLHGTGGSGEGMLRVGHFRKYAELRRFIAVAPNSLGRAFNEGSGRGGPEVKDVDDVSFIETVASDVRRRATIDPARIFLTGFSSGASMAQRMGLESSYEFAAIVAPADAFYVPARSPARPRPILLAWGTADKLNPMSGGKVPYGGGVVLDKPAPAQTAAGWAERLGCKLGPTRAAFVEKVETLTWSDCHGRARVELYLAEGLGHHWAGGEPIPFPDQMLGPYSAPFEMTQLMWQFFERSVK